MDKLYMFEIFDRKGIHIGNKYFNTYDEACLDKCDMHMNHFPMLNPSEIKTVYMLDPAPEITDVIFNDPATIIFWSDGTKTVVKATNEKFDQEKGLAMAISKKFLGNNSGKYFEEFKKWIPEESEEDEAEETTYTFWAGSEKIGEFTDTFKWDSDLGKFVFKSTTATKEEPKKYDGIRYKSCQMLFLYNDRYFKKLHLDTTPSDYAGDLARHIGITDPTKYHTMYNHVTDPDRLTKIVIYDDENGKAYDISFANISDPDQFALALGKHRDGKFETIFLGDSSEETNISFDIFTKITGIYNAFCEANDLAEYYGWPEVLDKGYAE